MAELTKPEGFRGEFLLPSHPDYDKFREPWNADHANKKPSVVLLPHGAKDVQVAIKWIHANKLEFAVMSGGHSLSGRSIKDGAVLIRLSRMNFVHVDPVERTAWVGTGATIADIDAETNAYNLVAVGGQVSHTGVGGFALHGGFGAISRRYGLAVDNMLAARVVLADGSLVEASEKENSDLFFAIRGAGSLVGVVTSIKFRLFPLAEGDLMCSGQAFWLAESDEDLRERVGAWSKIVDGSSENLYCTCIWTTPPPPPFNGRRTFIIHTAWLGDEPMDKAKEKLDAALAPLMAKEPVVNAIGPKPFSVFNSMQDPFGPFGQAKRATGVSTNDCNKLTSVLLETEKQRPPPSVYIVEHWGGKAKRPGRAPADDLVHRIRDTFTVLCLGCTHVPEFKQQALDWIQAFKAKAKEAELGVAAYVNYTEDNQKPYGECTDKLVKIKAKYDPDNFFPRVTGAA
ncbi:hypothetical protein PTSG_00121 [Salpingoeca rosetta]|uniref:FAD-binding PCMH-type domain-containing protein n=1 Tax=Salpingoeca rosetta (strain ATCC 50818 / BSB-021) TaxID=946362 RepID=F2TVK9_SALR5|nr:uncharacterized protein PTSG_00121 [Salpingoeca rosetta]EGD72105.1 hypothetical protein PTSG_00121 [Salpingoeca rosetta]|eukprot:XP_004998677.1 hypothetical protein PTSG_00121 [Salpingoeca rosetta]